MKPTVQVINPLSRGLPKTGQETSYQMADDGSYEAGWWQGRLNANNRQRFVFDDKSGDDVVIDRATGLMWAADGQAAGCNMGGAETWTDAISYFGFFPFAGYNDWRLPNVKELMSIIDYSLQNPCIVQPPFSNTLTLGYWCNTTYVINTVMAWYCNFAFGTIGTSFKTATKYIRGVRGGI